MRFFSREWTRHPDDKYVERVVAEYEVHLAALQGSIGTKIRTFASSRSLNDGLLDHLLIGTARRTVCLSLIVGDLQVGYSELKITYRDAEIVVPDIAMLRMIFQTRNVDIWYDEFDIAELRDQSVSCFCHRFLLSPDEFGEVVVRFGDIDFAERRLSQRGYVTFGETLEIQESPADTE